MKFDPKKHHRRSIQIKEYDYTQPGGYFIIIVTHQRDCLFGEIINEEMQLNASGTIVDECWHAIPNHFPNIELGAFVIMPNHVHGIIVINDRAHADASACRGTIPSTCGLGRCIVPLRNNSGNPLLVQFLQSFEHLRPLLRAVSDAN